MARAVIRLGDDTSHGGRVIEATARMTIDGIPVALWGDHCSCPHEGHDNCVICEGEPDAMFDGRPVALEGHKTSCGASLIASQLDRCTVSPLSSCKSSAAKISKTLAGLNNYDEYENSEIIEQYYEILDEQGEHIDGYAYDLFLDNEMHTKNSQFNDGRTASVESSGDIRLVAWLIKDGALRL